MSTAAPLQTLAAKTKALSNSTHAGLLLQRKCACGSPPASLTGECTECASRKLLQTKLAIGSSTDPLEQEADRVADQVLAAPANPAASGTPPRIQRFTGHESGPADSAPASVDHVLAGPGRPLEAALRQDMDQRFGHDFSGVRVHSGTAAEQSARDVNANAYTTGHHLVFGAGRFAPGTHEGRRLIAHELTHVVQQSGAQSVVRRQDASPPIAPVKEEQDMIEAARAAAAIRAQTALMHVRAIVPPGPVGRDDPTAQMRLRARRLAQRMFEWENPNMEQVEQIIGDMVSRLTSPEVRVAGAADPECGSRAAYVRGLSPPIVLCPTFFSDTPEQRTRTMVHEAAHLSRIGSADTGESYCVLFTCEQSCGGFDSADSWAQYVHCLSNQTPDQPEAVEAPSPGAAKARAEKEKARADAEVSTRHNKLADIADRVFDAMEGLGTDEEAVYRALQELDRDQKQINELTKIYVERHKSSLLDDIRDDFSGTELEFALQLLNLGHSDKPQTVEDELFLDPKLAAQRIRDAVQGAGTDEEAVYAALMPFRRDTLKLQRAYQELYAEDLRDRIEEEMSGSQLEYALDLMETPYERYLQEASASLKRFPAIGFGLPWKSNDWYDTRFWKPKYDSKSEEWMLELHSGLPHEAIDALFHEQERWHVDCTVFAEVLQLYALRQSLGARRFDQRVGTTMVLRTHRSSGLKSRELFKRESASAAFSVDGQGALDEAGNPDIVLAEAPIGSRVRWTSQLLFDKANNLSGPEVWTIDQQSWPNFQHENTVKLGPDRYGAQGVGGGGRVSREKIESELVDITAGQFPKKTRAEIRAGIYISEIEIFERPEAAEQIEPQAQDSEKGKRA